MAALLQHEWVFIPLVCFAIFITAFVGWKTFGGWLWRSITGGSRNRNTTGAVEETKSTARKSAG